MNSFLEDKKILVAGAGIGGLSCALALGARGANVDVYERRSEQSEAGAGIQIGPNGVRVLEALGVAGRLRESAGVPENIAVHDGASGNVLASLPLGGWMERRFGAPYWVLHRADLHAALRDAVSENSRITIQTGVEVDGFDSNTSGVTALSGETRLGRGDILVGADGLHSKIRNFVFSSASPIFAGMTASRAVLKLREGSDDKVRSGVGVWLSPRGHVVHYPVRSGRELAIVVIRRANTVMDGWDSQIASDNVELAVRDFAVPLRELVERAADWRSWSLFQSLELKKFVLGRTALLGDAAHPILPFLAQGGVMALEDAMVLSDALLCEANVDVALENFERRRQSRVKRVRVASKRNGRIYHMGGAGAAARNGVMKLAPGPLLMAQYDWLYNWRDYR